MNLIEIAQMAMIATGAVLLGRLGFAVTRWLEGLLNPSRLAPGSENRLQVLEEECARLRQEVTELQDRQDFTERALLQAPPSSGMPAPQDRSERFPTPR